MATGSAWWTAMRSGSGGQGATSRSAAFCADISHPDQCADVIAQVESGHGALDLLVLAAGVSCIGNVPAGDTRAWEHTLAVNTLGVMYCARAALPAMTQRHSGTIVVVASASGRVTYVGEPAYVASKHATVAFCDCLRKELVGSGVRVCVVRAGTGRYAHVRAHPHIEDIVGSVTPLRPSDIMHCQLHRPPAPERGDQRDRRPASESGALDDQQPGRPWRQRCRW